MDNDKLRYYKNMLLRDKKRLEYQLSNLEDEEKLSLKGSTGELSSYDNHPADEATNTFNREIDLGIKDNVLTILKEVKDSLAKIETGNYGICQGCGIKINDSRLEVVPYTSYCQSCKEFEEELEGVNRRPLAESSLYPPFGRSFEDGSDFIVYDGEDTWQDVAQYGTSDTPQDVPETITNGRESKETYLDSDELIGVSGIEDTLIPADKKSLDEAAEEDTTFYGEMGDSES